MAAFNIEMKADLRLFIPPGYT